MSQQDDDDPPALNGPLSREERLRRVAKLCVQFARNMAYYRAARNGGERTTQLTNFWNTVDGNFIDTAVLEWCKIFGDTRAHQYWEKVVTDPQDFETRLLSAMGIDRVALDSEIDAIKTYRDKFLAHLDSERVAFVPHLDRMWSSVRFCFEHVLKVEMTPDEAERVGLPSLETYYQECFAEARATYARSLTVPVLLLSIVTTATVTAAASALLGHAFA